MAQNSLLSLSSNKPSKIDSCLSIYELANSNVDHLDESLYNEPNGHDNNIVIQSNIHETIKSAKAGILKPTSKQGKLKLIKKDNNIIDLSNSATHLHKDQLIHSGNEAKSPVTKFENSDIRNNCCTGCFIY